MKGINRGGKFSDPINIGFILHYGLPFVNGDLLYFSLGPPRYIPESSGVAPPTGIAYCIIIYCIIIFVCSPHLLHPETISEMIVFDNVKKLMFLYCLPAYCCCGYNCLFSFG